MLVSACIKRVRKENGFTQRDLALRLRREQGMVARIELGERRVDLVEFYEIMRALDADAEKEAAELMRKFARSSRRVV